MREFVTAAKAVEDEGDTFGRDTTIKIDGRDIRFLPATEGQMALLLSTDMLPTTDRISIGVNLFFNLLRDDTDSDYFRARMFDRKDPFGSGEIAEIVQGLIEEWSGDPTQESSDSTPSPPPTGASSTARAPRKGSTRSSSAPIASVP
jgi:hypothetical protein